jgi:small redox-active disulfide protein 2
MHIKILGTGCPRCKTLEREVIDSLAEMNISANVSKVDDIMKIMEYGIMHTPALVIDEKVVLSGRVPGVSELKEIITKYQK